MALPGRGRFLLHLAAAAGGATAMGLAAGSATAATQAEVRPPARRVGWRLIHCATWLPAPPPCRHRTYACVPAARLAVPTGNALCRRRTGRVFAACLHSPPSPSPSYTLTSAAQQDSISQQYRGSVEAGQQTKQASAQAIDKAGWAQCCICCQARGFLLVSRCDGGALVGGQLCVSELRKLCTALA